MRAGVVGGLPARPLYRPTSPSLRTIVAVQWRGPLNIILSPTLSAACVWMRVLTVSKGWPARGVGIRLERMNE